MSAQLEVDSMRDEEPSPFTVDNMRRTPGANFPDLNELKAAESRIRSARELIKMFHEQYGDNGTVCAVLTLVDLRLGGES